MITSVDALPHPASGQDVAEPGRAGEGIDNGTEQRKAVYTDGRYQTRLKES